MPSRLNTHTSRISDGVSDDPNRPPYIPRRSSKRKSQPVAADFPSARLSTVTGSPPPSPPKSRSLGQKHLTTSTSSRLPFGVRNSLSKSSHYSAGAESTASSTGAIGDEENQMPALGHGRNPSSALGHHAPDIKGDRPSSMGYVPQHRASDNIRNVVSGSHELAGRTAEFVGTPNPRPGPV